MELRIITVAMCVCRMAKLYWNGQFVGNAKAFIEALGMNVNFLPEAMFSLNCLEWQGRVTNRLQINYLKQL